MKNFKPFFIFIFISSFLFTGCFGVSHKFQKVRDHLFTKLGKTLPADVEFSIGSISITAASWFVKNDSNDDMPERVLRHINHVQVGVYKNDPYYNASFDFHSFKSVSSELEKDGYKLIVCSVEGDEATAIFTEESDDEKLHKMFIINIDNKEVVLTEIEGELNEVLTEAVKNKKLDVNI